MKIYTCSPYGDLKVFNNQLKTWWIIVKYGEEEDTSKVEGKKDICFFKTFNEAAKHLSSFVVSTDDIFIIRAVAVVND